MPSSSPDPAARTQRIVALLTWLLIAAGVAGLGSLVAQYGFVLDDGTHRILHFVDFTVLALFVVQRVLRASIEPRPLAYLRSHKTDFALVGLIVLSFAVLAAAGGGESLGAVARALHIEEITRIYVIAAQIFVLAGIGLQAVRASHVLASLRIHPSVTLIAGFLVIIAVGTLALMLPRAAVAEPIRFVDALFMATSATCVTGLAVVDPATQLTGLGQVLTLVMIQIGGLGIMTFTTFFALLAGAGIGVKERLLMRELLNEENVGTIRGTLVRVLGMMLALEGVGAALLYTTWGDAAGGGLGRLSAAVFHAVSAFCNAGFSLFRDGMMHPAFAGNPAACLTIAFLIVAGGLGFPVVANIGRVLRWKSGARRGAIQRLSIHSRLVLFTTALLLAAGTAAFFLFEANGVLAARPPGERLLHSFFQSVTARTAGFNTVPVGALLTPTVLVMLALMFIGASPASTGGGIKTTTFALGCAAIAAFGTGRHRVEMFHRQISQPSLTRALVTLTLSLGVVLAGTLLLTLTEQAGFLDLIFEAVSAFGTVGLTRGITPSLTDAGKLVLIVLMLVGRVGALTVVLALLPQKDEGLHDYPQEDVFTS